MTEEQIFTQMAYIRTKTIKWVEEIDSAILDIMPTNFNNTLHWHLGHILLVQDRLTLRLMGEEIGLPEAYNGWFANGTKPADWITQPPTVETLLQELTQQTERLQKQIAGKLSAKLALPFLNMETLVESLNYSLFHEGMHLGYMMALKRAIGVKV